MELKGGLPPVLVLSPSDPLLRDNYHWLCRVASRYIQHTQVFEDVCVCVCVCVHLRYVYVCV